jgi:hypothetical protein
MTDRPFDRTRPFLRAAGEAAGISAATFRGPQLRQLFRGVWLDAGTEPDVELRARAVLLIAPNDAVVSRHTAAALWGGVAPPDWHTHVTTLRPSAAERAAQREARRRARGGGAGCTSAARSSLDWGRMDVDGVDARVSSNRERTATLRGIRLTDPVRTFLDLAEDLDLVDQVVLGDSLVRAGRTTTAELVAAAGTPGRHRRLARRAAALVRPGVDSPQETRTRMLCVLAGLPEPEVNIEFRDAEGRLVRRADLGYRRARVSIEYDGRQHAEDERQWTKDIERREQFDGWGWRTVVVTSRGLAVEPHVTLRRIEEVLGSRGQRARTTSQEWRRYFGPRHRRTA